MPRKLGCTPKALAISYIIIGEHKSVRRKVILLDLLRKMPNCLSHVAFIHNTKIHCIEALAFEPVKLPLLGITKIHIRLISLGIDRGYECKCLKPYIPLSGYLAVKLPYRAAAQISRVLVFLTVIGNECIYSLKIRVGDYRLSSYDKSSLIRNLCRKVLKGSGICRYDLTYISITTRDSLDKLAMFISKNYGQTIKLP